jgi:hypothetical protein
MNLQERGLWIDAQLKGIQASLGLDDDGLALGATRLLVKQGGALKFEGEEARLLTLLSVAYGRPIDASILRAIRRASKHAAAGDAAMAAMHIALAGMPRLANPPDAARRIMIADMLLAMGVRPRDIFTALEFDATSLDRLEKFNPEEPRNPKGSGRISGEWAREIETAEADAEAVVEGASRIAPAAIRVTGVASRLAAIGTAVASIPSTVVGGIVFLGAMVISTPAGGEAREGPVQGHPELRYSWNADATELRIFRESDGRTVLSSTLWPDGTLRIGPKRIGRKRGDQVEIDPFALPPDWPMRDESDDWRLCPNESPDRLGRPGDKGKKDKDFEDYVKLWVNPDSPTSRGFGYAFFNPETGNNIIFDDCQKKTGYLFDAKGTMYDWLLTNKSEKLRNDVLADLFETANRQINASEGRPIFWVFAEERAAEVAEKAFHSDGEEAVKGDKPKPDPKYKQIHFFVLPWWEGMK